ncbi:MAG: hypothetical protein ACKOQP_04560, partial [Bacteroidota bacterium]
LRSHWNNPSPLVNDIQSVYTVDKSLCSMIVIRDSNYTITAPLTGITIPYLCGTVKQVFFTARFWNECLYGSNSEMKNPTWSYSRNIVSVTQLSTLEKTSVDFRIDYQNPVDTVVFWLFDASQNNNVIDFFTNYDSSRSVIVDNPGTGIISNDLESPSTGPTLVIGTTYITTCKIGTNINPNGDYYIGAICYSSTDGMVNSFLYHFDPVRNGPEVCCDLDIVSEWADYNNIHPTQCYSTAPKERYRNILTIEGGALQLCMLNDWGMNPANSWIDYLKTMNLKVYQKVSNYPLAGRDAYFLFYDFSQNRDTAFPNNWANNNSFGQWLINDNGTTIESVFYNRSRY